MKISILHTKVAATVLSLLLLLAASCARAWNPEAAMYNIGLQTNVHITMNDGTVLMADIYYPTNMTTGAAAPGPFPVLITETPYGKWSATYYEQTGIPVLLTLAQIVGYEPYLIQRGYIEVIVDVRGTGASGGTFDLFGPAQVLDSVQLINWAASLPNSTGKVGMVGISYAGINQLQAAAAVGSGSHLKAIFPIVAGNDIYSDTAVPGGLLNLETDVIIASLYGLLPITNPFLEDPVNPQLLSTLTQHQSLITFSTTLILNALTNGDERYDGTYWLSRSPAGLLSKIVQNNIPVYLVGGLYDIFQAGEPMNYVGLQNAWNGRTTTAPMTANQSVTSHYQLLIKPQFHATILEGTPNLDPIQLAWFDYWLKNINTSILQTANPVHVIEPDGSWFNTTAYPVPQATPTAYYLNSGSSLTTSKPFSLIGSDTVVFTGVSLPCNQATEQWALGLGQLALNLLGLSDPCASQNIIPPLGPGQATYTTAPFSSTKVLAGPINLHLNALSTTTDTEWIAQLSMIAPDGTSIPITQGDLLGSFRALDSSRTWLAPDGHVLLAIHPFTQASQQLDVPGIITAYDIAIRPTFITIPAGYRLQLTISTSQLPNFWPAITDYLHLLGGIYLIQHNVLSPSFIELPLANPSSFDSSTPIGAAS